VAVEVTNLGPFPLRAPVLSAPNTPLPRELSRGPAAAELEAAMGRPQPHAPAQAAADAARSPAPALGSPNLPGSPRFAGLAAGSASAGVAVGAAAGLAAMQSGARLAVVALDGTLVLAAASGGEAVLGVGAAATCVVRYLPLAKGLVRLAPLTLAASPAAPSGGGGAGGGGGPQAAAAAALAFTSAAFPLDVLVR